MRHVLHWKTPCPALISKCRPVPCSGQAQTLVPARREGAVPVLAPAVGLSVGETTTPSPPAQTQWVHQKVQSSASRHVVGDTARWSLLLSLPQATGLAAWVLFPLRFHEHIQKNTRVFPSTLRVFSL